MKQTLFLLTAVSALSFGGYGQATVGSPRFKQALPKKEAATPDGRVNGQKSDAPHRVSGICGMRHVVATDGGSFSCTFDNEAALADFIIVNANNDQNVWHWQGDDMGGGQAAIGFNTQVAMDDWLISPAIHLEAGHRYIVSFEARGSSSNYAERVGLYISRSTDPTAEKTAMVEPLTPPSPSFGMLADYGGYFTPEESGDYHVMVHGCSDANKSTLIIDNILVSSPDAVPAPSYDGITYIENALIDENFEQVPGSVEEPVLLTDSQYNLIGLDGWRGYDVYGIGGAIMIDGIGTQTNWPQAAPPFVTMTNLAADGYHGKVILEAKPIEYSDEAKMWNNWEGVNGTGMVGSTDSPRGWRYGGSGSSFGGYFGGSDWETFENEITLITEGTLIMDDFCYPDDTHSLGTFHTNRFSARITPYNGSRIALRKYKVVEATPEVELPTTPYITDYDSNGVTFNWESADNATSYIVDLYEGTPTASYMKRIDRKHVTGTECRFDTDTRDGRFLYVNMFAANGEIRSPLSNTNRVFAVGKPTFGPLEQPKDNVLKVPFTCDPISHNISLTAYAGYTVQEDTEAYPAAQISFADFPNQEPQEYSLYLDQAPGWLIFPMPEFEDGAFKGNNTSAWWGTGDYMTFYGRCSYDFSEVEGPITVSFTGKTEGECMVKVNLLEFDERTRDYNTYASAETPLTIVYDTHTVQIDPQGKKNVNISIVTGGQSVNYFKDVTVTVPLKANDTFMIPFLTGNIDVSESGKSQGYFNLPYPGKPDMLRIGGQDVRQLYDADGNYYYTALSHYADYADVKVDNSGISTPDAETDADTRYYTLDGFEVKGGLSNGIYIRICGDKRDKIVINNK